MKKFEEIIWSLTILLMATAALMLVFFAILAMRHATNELHQKNNELRQENNELRQELGYFKNKYGDLDNALVSSAKKEYNEEYRCLEFSKDLVEELKSKGIQAEVVKGESPATIDDPWGHAWVGIWIDPQSGKFTKDYQLWTKN
jgi:septal ring factor EnvC (AmiA/AmiB activator)